jgi:uncharacterized protein (UPF0548 family)
MSVRRLPPRDEARLRALQPSYAGVGATSAPPIPAGFRGFEHRAVLGHGRGAFQAAADDLLHWRMQARTGLRPVVSSEVVVPGAVVLMRAGLGPVGLPIPCRVLYVVDEPDRRGFAYATLAGHPESGEERFVVALEAGDTVTLTVSGFSRPGLLLTRLAGPLTRAGAWAAILRYGRALRRGQ